MDLPAAEDAEASWTLWPNPATDAIHIRWSGGRPGDGEWVIRDLAGRIWGTTRSFDHGVQDAWDLRSLPAGLYIMTWGQDGQQSSRTFVRMP